MTGRRPIQAIVAALGAIAFCAALQKRALGVTQASWSRSLSWRWVPPVGAVPLRPNAAENNATELGRFPTGRGAPRHSYDGRGARDPRIVHEAPRPHPSPHGFTGRNGGP